MNPERALWSAVLMQAIKDAFPSSQSGNNPFYQSQARSWIGERPTKNFVEVCEICDLDPSTIHKVLLQYMNCDKATQLKIAKAIKGKESARECFRSIFAAGK